MNNDNVTKLDPAKSDTMLAKEIREELTTVLEKVADILQRAAKADFVVNFTIGPDSNGKFVVNRPIVTKNY